jgi:NADH-quinone oxidoreductase subunit L
MLLLIPLLPLLGFLVNATVGRRLTKSLSGGVACLAIIGAFAVSVLSVLQFWSAHAPIEQTVFTWIASGNLQIPFALRVDPLSSLMILVVTGIGSLIHIYSTGYMHDEPDSEFARYFSYLNLFAAFMLVLVLGASFPVMFVGWEGVGLCSYLLIGFWFTKKSAADAGKKAFIVNRIGDFGFILGMLLLFVTFGTLDFQGVAAAADLRAVEHGTMGVLTVATLLLFLGATGKSAQIPLYVWLPDAMEGPTPVSALIHAATMVTAGVYMIGRNAVLFSHAPTTLAVVAGIGAATALMAGTIGLVQNDIKRVLAYSTVSQLGYMFTAIGVGAFSAGAFHLMTHAFFKALLFLGSGSVIHAMGGEQDMRRMGALKKYLPVTFATMMIGTAAIAGLPPFAGFFSKDEILFRAFLANKAIWVLAVLTALMTAFYMSRLMAMTFFGSFRGPAWETAGQAAVVVAAQHGAPHPADPHAHGKANQKEHEVSHGPAEPHEETVDDGAHGGHGHGAWHGPHESPAPMTFPLMVLAVGAIVAGFVGIPAALGGGNSIEQFLEPSFTAAHGGATAGEVRPNDVIAGGDLARGQAATGAVAALEHGAGASEGSGEHVSRGVELGLMGFSVLIAVIGISLAWKFYVTSPEISEQLAERWAGLHRLLLNKYYVDEAYDATVISGTLGSGRVLWLFDRKVVDGAVNGVGRITIISSWLSGLTDRTVVDGLVNLVGWVVQEGSHGFRRLQTGLVQNYALLMLFGVFAFVSMYLFVR